MRAGVWRPTPPTGRARRAAAHGSLRMSTLTAPRAVRLPQPTSRQRARVGPIGRLGRYTATHFRIVLIGWLAVAVVLGFFAPRVENALSGAGWEASGSQ